MGIFDTANGIKEEIVGAVKKELKGIVDESVDNACNALNTRISNLIKSMLGKHIVLKLIAGIAIGVYVGMMAHTLTLSIYQSIVK